MSQTSQFNDQAEGLRATMAQHLGPEKKKVDLNAAKIMAVTGGKGGVGKTSITCNLAYVMAQAGKKVLVIDADLGLANVDVTFGLTPQFNLNHFFAGQKTLTEILADGPEGIKILPAGSGIQRFTKLTANDKRRFLAEMDTLPENFDTVLIDTEAGISENVTYFSAAAQQILMVCSPDPRAITDAYALMKLLSNKYHERHFSLIVNSVRNEAEALNVYRDLTLVSNRYLDVSIDYLGGIPYDEKMFRAVKKQKVATELYPKSKLYEAFSNISSELLDSPIENDPKGTLQFFWERLLSFTQSNN